MAEREPSVTNAVRARDELREAILTGSLPPGARGAADDAAVEDQVALNEEFHRTIIAAAGSPRLEAALRAVAGIPRAFRTAFWHDDGQREQSLFCHRQILRALEGR